MKEKKEVKRVNLISEVDTVAAVAVVDTKEEIIFLNQRVDQIPSSEITKMNQTQQEKENNLLEEKRESYSVTSMKRLVSTRSPCITRTEVLDLSTIITLRDNIKKRINQRL